MVNFVVLISDGNIKDIQIKLKADIRNKPFKNILRYKKMIELFTVNFNVGKGKLNEIHTWIIGNNKLVAYGYLKGQKKNNHELPLLDETKNNKTYYDDIIIVKLNNNNILLDITTDEYEEMYNDLYYNPSNEVIDDIEDIDDIDDLCIDEPFSDKHEDDDDDDDDDDADDDEDDDADDDDDDVIDNGEEGDCDEVKLIINKKRKRK